MVLYRAIYTRVKANVKGCRDDTAKTTETRVLYADKSKDMWQGAI